METAAEIYRNFTQRVRNFVDFMDEFASDETPTFRSASISEQDIEEQVGPELDTSYNGHGGPTADSNDVFRGFYRGEHHDENPLNTPGPLGFELPTPPPVHDLHGSPLTPSLRISDGAGDDFERYYGGELNLTPIPLSGISPSPHMLAASVENSFARFQTGGHHPTFDTGAENPFARFQTGGHHPTFDAGPASSMPAGANFLNQLPNVSLDDTPNVTSCNICMESFGSTENPELPVQLPCGHVMGRKCISRWLETSNSCPMCRHVLFEQGRSFAFAQEGTFLSGQEELNRSWENLEPRMQQLVQSMTAQEQQHLVQMLQDSNPQETETAQREQLQIPGVSPEEVEAYQAEYHGIMLQRDAIDARLEEIEAVDSALTPQRVMEIREIEEDNEMLSVRLNVFHARYRDLIDFTLFN